MKAELMNTITQTGRIAGIKLASTIIIKQQVLVLYALDVKITDKKIHT